MLLDRLLAKSFPSIQVMTYTAPMWFLLVGELDTSENDMQKEQEHQEDIASAQVILHEHNSALFCLSTPEVLDVFPATGSTYPSSTLAQFCLALTIVAGRI